MHLLKNVRNNLLNAKKFVFPSFSFSINDQLAAASENGYKYLRAIYDENLRLEANLRIAIKLTFQTLHPENNEQNVNLAFGIFHESTILLRAEVILDTEKKLLVFCH